MIIYEFIQKGQEKKVFYQHNIDHFKAFELFANNSRPIEYKDTKEFKIGSLEGKLTKECLYLTFTIGFNTLLGDDNGKIYAMLRKFCGISPTSKHDYGKFLVSETTIYNFEKGKVVSCKAIKRAYEGLIIHYVNYCSKKDTKIISKQEILSKPIVANNNAAAKARLQNQIYKNMSTLLNKCNDISSLFRLEQLLEQIDFCYQTNPQATDQTLKKVEYEFFNVFLEETKIS